MLGRTLDRHLLREIIVPFLSAVLLVTLLVLLLQSRRLAHAALGLGLTLTDAGIILAATLPPFLVIAIPLAYLLAVMVGLGRMSAENQIVALLSAGVSPKRIAVLPVLFGLLLAFLVTPIAHYGVPFGMTVLFERLTEVGLRNLSRAAQPGVFYADLPGLLLYAEGQDQAGQLQNVFVYDERQKETPVFVAAAKGKLVPDDQRLILELSGGEAHTTRRDEAYDRLSFERALVDIDVRRQLKDRSRFVSESKRMRSSEMLAVARGNLRDPLYRRRTERDFWRRFSHPMMVLIFGMIGAGLVLRSQRRRHIRNAIAALLLVVFYYLLGRGTDYLVTHGIGSIMWAVAMPNLVLLAVALYLLLVPEKPA